jgi:hypothetical protein
VDALNDPDVQAGFDQLWKESNPPPAPLGDRKEHFGWLVWTESGGWAFHDTGLTGNVCGLDAEIPYPPEGAAAIRAFVHTHPYAPDEIIPVCSETDTERIVGYAPYGGTPSRLDRMTSVRLGERLYGPGHTLSGLILDSKDILSFVGFNTDRDGGISRCGY